MQTRRGSGVTLVCLRKPANAAWLFSGVTLIGLVKALSSPALGLLKMVSLTFTRSSKHPPPACRFCRLECTVVGGIMALRGHPHGGAYVTLHGHSDFADVIKDLETGAHSGLFCPRIKS